MSPIVLVLVALPLAGLDHSLTEGALTGCPTEPHALAFKGLAQDLLLIER